MKRKKKIESVDQEEGKVVNNFIPFLIIFDHIIIDVLGQRVADSEDEEFLHDGSVGWPVPRGRLRRSTRLKQLRVHQNVKPLLSNQQQQQSSLSVADTPLRLQSTARKRPFVPAGKEVVDLTLDDDAGAVQGLCDSVSDDRLDSTSGPRLMSLIGCSSHSYIGRKEASAFVEDLSQADKERHGIFDARRCLGFKAFLDFPQARMAINPSKICNIESPLQQEGTSTALSLQQQPSWKVGLAHLCDCVLSVLGS